jgi:hypothetical protein
MMDYNWIRELSDNELIKEYQEQQTWIIESEKLIPASELKQAYLFRDTAIDELKIRGYEVSELDKE